MEILKINNKNPDLKIITQAVEILNKSGVVVMPTETAYGLAADATNKKAVEKIYKIKGRSFKKFLPLIVSSVSQAKKYFKISKQELELFKKYRGLSVIIRPGKEIFLVEGQEDCAVRISTNKVCKLLVRRLGRPITATSANRTGRENCYSVEEVLKQKIKSVLILDVGKLNKKKPSTIVKVSGGEVAVLRQGEVKIN